MGEKKQAPITEELPISLKVVAMIVVVVVWLCHLEAMGQAAMESKNFLQQINTRLSRIEGRLGIVDKSDK